MTDHEKMTREGTCPRCGERCERDEVDIGVGVQCGPWGCPACGWSESEDYDLQFGGGFQEDGSYLDPRGGMTPASNPVIRAMHRYNMKAMG